MEIFDELVLRSLNEHSSKLDYLENQLRGLMSELIKNQEIQKYTLDEIASLKKYQEYLIGMLDAHLKNS
jgi:hypothetical protein